MRIYDEKAARIISIIYHGGPDAFRHLEGILRETKQECPEALEDVWRYCRNIAPVPGIDWEAAVREELFGGWGEDERKEDVAELAVLMAKNILEREITEKDDEKLIGERIKEWKNND